MSSGVRRVPTPVRAYLWGGTPCSTGLRGTFMPWPYVTYGAEPPACQEIPAASPPRIADIAGDGGQHHGRPVVLLSIGGAAGGYPGDQGRGLGRGVFPGQAGDRGRRHAGDGLGPGRGLGYAVLGAEDVVLEVIEAQAVGVDEALVLAILGDDHVGHGHHHGGVGAGHDGYPLLGKGRGGGGVAGIDRDDPGCRPPWPGPGTRRCSCPAR